MLNLFGLSEGLHLCKINLLLSAKIKLKVFPDFIFYPVLPALKLFRFFTKKPKISIVQSIEVIEDIKARKLTVTAANLKIDLLLNKA